MGSGNGEESFRARNRRRREENAFANLYAYAQLTGIQDPAGTAEREARRIHGSEASSADGGPMPRSRAGKRTGTSKAEKVPHRLEDRTKEQLYTRAQELEIDGRSQMTKDELVQAIRRSS
jgi:hypothetical protein